LNLSSAEEISEASALFRYPAADNAARALVSRDDRKTNCRIAGTSGTAALIIIRLFRHRQDGPLKEAGDFPRRFELGES
jgi:hypothetical protein